VSSGPTIKWRARRQQLRICKGPSRESIFVLIIWLSRIESPATGSRLVKVRCMCTRAKRAFYYCRSGSMLVAAESSDLAIRITSTPLTCSSRSIENVVLSLKNVLCAFCFIYRCPSFEKRVKKRELLTTSRSKKFIREYT
jgi:hypothetical protein